MKITVKSIDSAKMSNQLRKILRRRGAKISAAIAAHWRREVQASAISSRAKSRYLQAIVPYAGNNRIGARLARDVKIVSILEFGFGRFDMKPGLLKKAAYRRVPLLKGKIIRTVSENSKPGSWIHPGVKGAKTLDKVRKAIKDIIKEALGGSD